MAEFSAQASSAPPVISSQLRGETMAFAVQNGLYGLAANFFEPYINYRFQRHYGSAGHHGSYVQNLVGEFAGDVAGMTALIGAEAIASRPLHAFSRTVREFIDPLYDTVARSVLIKECNSPDFEKKVSDWKVFQERNLVRSGIMMTASVAGNVATQKILMKNESPTKYILEGKLLGATITAAIGLAARFAFPNQLKSADHWLGSKLSPYMEDTSMIEEKPKAELNQLNSAVTYQPAVMRS